MVKPKNIRHMLRNEKHWNPFSDQYDAAKVDQDLNKYSETLKENPEVADQDDQLALNIVENGPIFNIIFKQIYDYMRDAVERTKAHPEQIMKFLISLGNHDTILINKTLDEKIQQDNSDGIKIEEVSGIQIESRDGRTQVNVVGAFEMQVDLLNNLLNYLRYFLNTRKLHDNYDEDHLFRIAAYLYTSSNLLVLVKDSYDRITWEDGSIREFPENELHLVFNKQNYLKLLKVGQHRIDRNVLSTIMETQTIYSKRLDFKALINLKRKKACLSEVLVDSRGFVSIRVTSTGDYPFNDEMLNGLATIVSFYPHIHLEELKGLERLTIRDILSLYSDLLVLAKALRESLLNVEDPQSGKEMKRLFIRIKKKELLSYLQSVTLFSKSQIESFLSIIEFDLYNIDKKIRINLWTKPLIRTRDVYFLLLSSLQAPNYLQLIDEWLESAKYSLDERGKALEKVMKEDLQKYLKGKGKYAIIPEKQKFYANKRDFEEIDLIISMEKMIFIAEIKNIKYPMEARDFHNGYKRLKEGANQVKRKRDFLIRNRSCFDSELQGIDGKNIHVAVITNYPHFTGMEIDGVPVIDYLALQSYMNKGEIKDYKVHINDSDEPEMEVMNTVRLWSNMDEFYERFEAYLRQPTIVKNLIKDVILKLEKISLDKASTQMFMQVASHKTPIPIS
ncbi:hypothetical protein FE784_00665 [Paenibacillus hemerocallicola]|uniref:NERD domain-containing protein n=1 Tax=Paenibacillus hemerocallicola TaxID=1172614 RepID=A0A5C4TIE1_9BACL|nr:hypothetical protein [Paenibacillus hemerocallicola]TNJ68209.1 hypothetical protein FE784_00665 [Paenibacillus hemerocallicola]